KFRRHPRNARTVSARLRLPGVYFWGDGTFAALFNCSFNAHNSATAIPHIDQSNSTRTRDSLRLRTSARSSVCFKPLNSTSTPQRIRYNSANSTDDSFLASSTLVSNQTCPLANGTLTNRKRKGGKPSCWASLGQQRTNRSCPS